MPESYHLGAEAIPRTWLELLEGRDRLTALADGLAELQGVRATGVES
jgi:hypothetical protein